MPPLKELPEHVEFWLTLRDKIIDAVIRQEPHIVKGGDDGMESAEGGDEMDSEVLSELSQYSEVNRLVLESSDPEDTSMLEDQAHQLIFWTQSTRKEFLKIRLFLHREMEIFLFEYRMRAMISLVHSLHHQIAQEKEMPIAEENIPHPLIREPPQSTSRLAHELQPSSAQIESHIARISHRLTGLASARHAHEIRLALLQKEIETSLSPPLVIRPIGTALEDIASATRSIVEYNSQSITRETLDNLRKTIERRHEELVKKTLRNCITALEILYRTVIKQYEINPALQLFFENVNF